MKKIITALGNEKINNELKQEKNIEIIINDIQYKEGIIEILEKYQNIDYIILKTLISLHVSHIVVTIFIYIFHTMIIIYIY